MQAITSTGAKKGDLFLADVGTKFTNKNVTTDVKVDTNSNVGVICFFIDHTVENYLFSVLETSILW